MEQSEFVDSITAADILGNTDYPAISYGGYRKNSRDFQPIVAMIKEDLLLLHAMGIRVLRTYNVHLPHAARVLEAIQQIREADPLFEMYVMLGAWIDCKNAWTSQPPIHTEESESNAVEIERAVELANAYPDIVKIIAVGNEAMVKWAESYYVQPSVILRWVRHLQHLRQQGELPSSLWITSSDNFAAWGGGDPVYHVPELDTLIQTVDFISLHTYPMHDTHYNPIFWGCDEADSLLSKEQCIQTAMRRALNYAQQQYRSVQQYVVQLGVQKPIHIGETGWASFSTDQYGAEGSRATDEYKAGLYYKLMRDWTQSAGITCFYFEAFDEPWKDAQHPNGSENHFGLFTVEGDAKYAIWPLVEQQVFRGLGRHGKPVTKTHGGQVEALLEQVLLPPIKSLQYD